MHCEEAGMATYFSMAAIAHAFVGAALCCEEAGMDTSFSVAAMASSQHKAAPTSG
ncbi:hypothetical protein PPUJ20066_52420 [Pseudomonas putida]|nr:hypothetical protein PPUJ20066_52420 [Pseudomonas putida]